MTNHQVNDLAHSFVAMATAFERLPQVEAELADWQDKASKRTDHIMTLEQHIQNYKAEIEGLHEQIRSLEVAKDAAETMFLEADDRTARALDFIKATFGNAGSLIQALEPPKAVEPPQVASSHEPEAKMTELEHTATTSTDINERIHANNELADLQASHDAQPVSEVAAQPDPTAVASAAEPQTATVTDTSSNPGPYANQLYFHVPGWMSREDWIAGGGTNESYDWRPGQH